jgi:hypothetical protein
MEAGQARARQNWPIAGGKFTRRLHSEGDSGLEQNGVGYSASGRESPRRTCRRTLSSSAEPAPPAEKSRSISASHAARSRSAIHVACFICSSSARPSIARCISAIVMMVVFYAKHKGRERTASYLRTRHVVMSGPPMAAEWKRDRPVRGRIGPLLAGNSSRIYIRAGMTRLR